MGVLAVTGSTGNVGGRVARLLAAAGVPQRLIVRDPARAPRLAGASLAIATYSDGEAARRALDGVQTLFMVSGAEAADRVDQHRSFIDTAVAQDDIAEVVSAVLREPAGYDAATLSLTGREALTFHDIAEVLGARYEPETVDEAYASRAKYGAPDWQVDAWVSTYTAVAAGELAGITDTVQRITGHPPRTLADLLER